MCHMPAVCEEKGLPYVYTPSRFKRMFVLAIEDLKTMMLKRDCFALAARVTQLLLACHPQARPGNCHGREERLFDDDGAGA